MKQLLLVFTLFGALLGAGSAVATVPVQITLAPDTRNPTQPQMGDRLTFNSLVRNTGHQPVSGLVVWISLVQVDPGKEQPVDLEDWSAHKAVVRPVLAPGEAFSVDWPMRLIQAGDYRVVISAAERHAGSIAASPFADFHVKRKPTVESKRILPVAIGMPLLIAGYMGWRLRRNRKVIQE